MPGQNVFQVALDVQGAVQHHVHGPGRRHPVLPRRRDAHLLENFFHPAFGDEDMPGHHGRVILPPAAEGEGLGGLVAVHGEGDGEGDPQLGLHPQQLQHTGVGGGLVGPLLGQAALYGIAKTPVGVVGVGVTHLHMVLIEGFLGGHAQEAPQAPFLDGRVVFQFFKLFLGHVFERPVAVAPRLAEVGLLETVVDGQGDDEQGGKQNRRQRNGHDGDGVAGLGRPHGLSSQPADAGFVGYPDHGLTPCW